MYAGVPALACFVDTNVLHQHRAIVREMQASSRDSRLDRCLSMHMREGILDLKKEVCLTCLSLNLAMPKSQTFARPFPLRSTLDDFRSLQSKYHLRA